MFNSCLASVQTLRDRMAAGLDCAIQIALIQLVRGFLPIWLSFDVEMAMIYVTIQEYAANALTLVARCMKSFLLRKPKWRISGSNRDDLWATHVPPSAWLCADS
jgi:hypothetical protein